VGVVVTALPLTVPVLTIDVCGIPAPQGSKIGRALPGGGVSLREANKALPAWRAAVIAATQARMRLTGWTKLDGPIGLRVDFYMPRPASVTRERPTVPPDGDKMLRAVADSLKLAAAIVDDSRIVSWHAEEWYAKTITGARIVVKAIA
jgi:Holliday junction resolvase RusA-like endonuclease